MKYTISFNALGTSGQLGNQLFQFIALINIAKINNLNVLIPNPKNNFEYEYFYNHFNTSDSLVEIKFGISNYEELSDELSGFILFDKNLLSINKDVNINGYFQSLKYLRLERATLKNTIRFKEKYNLTANIIAKDFDLKTFSFLHVRRKDYIEKKQYHFPLGKTYYKKAIMQFDQNSKFLLFSDDLIWCKKQEIFKNENITFIDEILKEDYQDLNKDVLELCLMSKCNGGIISNSTFSWWGAWFQNKNGKIVSPNKNVWFGYKYNFNAEDLILETWKTVGDSIFKSGYYKILKFLNKII